MRLKTFFAGVLLWLSACLTQTAFAAGALVNLPPLVTDVDYAFDFSFFDGTVSNPHNLPADTFTLTLLAKNISAPKITLSTADPDPSLTVTANSISLRITAALASTFHAAGYNYELRHIVNGGATELLATGTITMLDGLSLPATLASPGLQAATIESANIIYTDAQAQVVYSNSPGLLTPTADSLGGVKAAIAPTHQFQTGIDTTGTPTFAQPSAGDVSGLGSAALLNVGQAPGTLAAGDDPRIVGSLQSSLNLSDLGNVATARTNLGLGSAATTATGTSGHALPFLDTTNTWSSPQTFSNVTITANPVLTGTAGPTTTGFYGNETVTGTFSSVNSTNANQIIVNDSSANTGGGLTHGYSFKYNFGGAALQGNHGGMTVTSTFNATSGNTGPGFAYDSFGPSMTVQTSDNGTGVTSTTSRGLFFAMNPIAKAVSGATNLTQLQGAEFDVDAEAGSSMYKKGGVSIILLHNDAVKGAGIDAALLIGAQDTGTNKWTYGIQFASPDGSPTGSVDGTLIGCPTKCGTVVAGVDLSNFAITANAWASPGASISGAGALSVLSHSQSGALSVANLNNNTGPLFTVANSLVDTGDSGTVAVAYLGMLKGTTVTASAPVTVTDLYALDIEAPVCSTNVTCPNADALRLNGRLGLNGNAIFGVTALSSNAAAGYKLNSGAASGTVATISPNGNDTKAGIGSNTAGNLSFIADNAGTATEIARVTPSGLSLQTGVYSSGAANGVTCSGSPTASFASTNGIVTHC